MSVTSKNTIEIPAPGAEPESSAIESAQQPTTPVCWEIPVRIYGPRGSAVASGRTEQTEPFLEETHTLILFPQGGVVRLSARVSTGQALLLTNEHSNQEVLCRVTSVRAAANGQAYVEFEFTKPQDSFWGAHCPSEPLAPASSPVSTAVPAVPSVPAAAQAAPVASRTEARQVESRQAGPQQSQPAHEAPNASRTSQAPPQSMGSPAAVPPPAAPSQVHHSTSGASEAEPAHDVWSDSFPSKALRLDPVPGASPDQARKRPNEASGIRKVVAKPAGNFITPSAIGAISAAADSVIAAEMPLEAHNAASGPPPLVRPPASAVPTERAHREIAHQPVGQQTRKDPANLLFNSPTGAEFHNAAPMITGTSSPQAIGDSLGDLGDWKTPPPITPALGRFSSKQDSVRHSGHRADQYATVTQVEEERDPNRLWIFGGTGVGVLIILSILMFSHGPAKTAASTNTPGTEEISALQPPKPPSPWDAKSFVSTSRANLATPPSKKSSESNSDLFLSDTPSQAKSSIPEERPEATERPKQNRKLTPSERLDSTAPAERPVFTTPAAKPRPEPSSSLPESTIKKLMAQPAVPERSASQSQSRQAAAPPDVRDSPSTSPQNGLSGISPSSAPAAESPEPRQEAAPKGPVQVGGRIKAPQLLHSVPPQYPPMARQAHVEGDVVVDLVIDASGKVTTMKVVSGPLLLRDAATTALSQWQYQPTRLNDQAVPVEMQVLIKFKM